MSGIHLRQQLQVLLLPEQPVARGIPEWKFLQVQVQHPVRVSVLHWVVRIRKVILWLAD
ncbi:hypothetical protein D3C80_1836830 [compost metagenome]